VQLSWLEHYELRKQFQKLSFMQNLGHTRLQLVLM